jgi:diguanylate cyclase (GGDEF)-like protein
MDDSTADDGPARPTNGRVNGDQDPQASAPAAMERNQTRVDAEQTRSDEDQTAADTDQTAADNEQAAADSDQAAADTDQEASDRDLAQGGDPDVHDATRELRDQGAQQRREGNQHRVDAAVLRDAVALGRDQAAEARDRAATLLDRELEARDAAEESHAHNDLKAEERLRRLAANRRRAADARAAAAQARLQAAEDRRQAGNDREQAALDRLEAREQRDALLSQLADSQVDPLTGARARAPGLKDLDREISRARRTEAELTVAYVDVVGLKAVNDTRGHAAGDTLLRDLVEAISSHLRTYDSIVRLGGDEFLCFGPGSSIENVRKRFDSVQARLETGPNRCRFKVGLTALEPGDTAESLIERADSAMPASPA